MEKKFKIVIPARFASTRLPGKPLLKIAGKEMVKRVYENAAKVANKFQNVSLIVATDDERIENFCKENNMNVICFTDPCRSGTERAQKTILKLNESVDYVINLQGDNPTCPPWFVEEMINEFNNDEGIDVITPCVNLTWEGLDKLRESKIKNPFSGTTVVFNAEKKALWFSKNIIPAIRKEEKLREEMPLSPVFRHIGLYGYKASVLLNQIGNFKESYYEKFEGLEQLSFLENGLTVKVFIADYKGRTEMSGVDTEDDLKKAESIFLKEGDFEY